MAIIVGIDIDLQAVAVADREFLLDSGEAGPFPFPGVRAPLPGPGILRRLRVSIDPGLNTLDAALIVTVLLNGVATWLSISYAAGETGLKSNDIPFAYADGDKVSFRATTAAANGSASLATAVEVRPA